jgi:hypothetical protein
VVRYRGLKYLRGVPKESAIPVEPDTGLIVSSLVRLLYPDNTDQCGLTTMALGLIGRDSFQTTGDLRKLLSGLDRQAHPSPVSIRFRREDTSTLDLEDFSITLDRADASVSAIIADRGEYEPHVAAALREYCKPGMTVVDVGANIGYHTMLLSRLVGHEGRVMAFEPSSESCA